MKTKAIIVDIDGTLADHSHRLHYVQGEKKQWDLFFDDMSNDSINEWCHELINSLKSSGYQILLVSGRPRDYEETTVAWLKKYKVEYDDLFCRKAGDYRSDSIVKKEIYQENISEKYEILFVVDDRFSVIKMWRELGLICLDCKYNLD